jgi:homoserine O-succinyltransferase
MPLVSHNGLPTFQRLRERGQKVLTLEKALQQDIRELHIGLLNMMPDAALAATEQQFISLLGSCNQIAQFYVYPFTVSGLNRGQQATDHIQEHYFEFDDLASRGLDALVITGANVVNQALDQESFWEPLAEIVTWAEDNVASILCSCLATHALVKLDHAIDRKSLPNKQWGVYNHRISQPDHPLMRGVNTRFDAPHSRYNSVSRAQMEAAEMVVLVESPEVGVHMAVSPDQFRKVYFQGHPEYDAVSLLKEYKREVFRFLNGELETAPLFPENYFSDKAIEVARNFILACTEASRVGDPLPDFPETELTALVDNTWGDTGKAIVNNWLGLVYELTDLDRKSQFMPGVDPNDPLQIRTPHSET